MALGYSNSSVDPSAFENDLAAQQEIALQLEQEKRDAKRRGQQNQLSEFAKDQLKQKGKELGEQAVRSGMRNLSKVGTRSAATAGAEGVVAAGGSAVGVPVLIGIAAVITVVIFVLMILFGMFMSVYYVCNSDSYSSVGVRAMSYLGSWVGYEDVCAAMKGSTETVPPTVADQNASMSADGDAQARAFLAGFGISVNAPQPQTSLEGILQSTLNEVVAVKLACDQWAKANNRTAEMVPLAGKSKDDSYCEVVVTGGTEGGHATQGRCVHSKGFKIDLRLRPNLDAYIKSHFTPIAPRGNEPRWYNNNSNATYALESDHWDIMIGCA